jgi:hypothetical protein
VLYLKWSLWHAQGMGRHPSRSKPGPHVSVSAPGGRNGRLTGMCRRTPSSSEHLGWGTSSGASDHAERMLTEFNAAMRALLRAKLAIWHLRDGASADSALAIQRPGVSGTGFPPLEG